MNLFQIKLSKQELMMKNKMLYNCNYISDTINFAKILVEDLHPRDVICLNGDLGTGKTVIAKSISKILLVKDEVISPTFNILKIYNTHNDLIKKIYHFDLYRIKSHSELDNIGFEEYIYNNDSISIIEWPDIAKEYFIMGYKNITIEFDKNDENKRLISYESFER